MFWPKKCENTEMFWTEKYDNTKMFWAEMYDNTIFLFQNMRIGSMIIQYTAGGPSIETSG